MSSTKKTKLSTSTALVVVQQPVPVKLVPVTKERVKAWKVYRLYCHVTKASYFGICLSTKTVGGLTSSFNYGVRKGHSELSCSSVRQYGMENHTITFVTPNFDVRADALAEKGRIILRFSRNRPLLNQNAQTECEVILTARRGGKTLVEDWARGALSPSWSDADNAGEDTDGE